MASAWFRVVNRVPSILSRTCSSDRIDATLQLLHEVYEDEAYCDLPGEIDLWLYADDIPPNELCLAYSSCPGSEVIAIPSFVNGIAFIPALSEFAEQCETDLNIPFEDREDVLFWIGGLTEYRSRTLSLMSQAPHTEFRMGYDPATLVSLAQHNKYKYLLDLQGIGWSMRLMWLMWLGSVVFVLDRDFHEYWFRDNFEPWVHYVPVAHDGSDLQVVYDKVRAMPDKGKHIADACRERARVVLTKERAKGRLAEAIGIYASRSGQKNAA